MVWAKSNRSRSCRLIYTLAMSTAIGTWEASVCANPLSIEQPTRSGRMIRELASSFRHTPASTDGAKLWTGSANDGLWSNSNNWTPTGTPVAGDSIVFNTASTEYVVNNDLPVGGPLFGSIAFDGTSLGWPVFTNGFTSGDLLANSLGGAVFTSGSYQFHNQAIFRGQSEVDVNSAALLTSTSPGATAYLWDQASLNINNGGSMDLGGSDSVLAIDDAAALNINAGGSAHSTFALVGNDQTAGPRRLNLNGSGARMRVDFQTLVHTSGFSSPAGVVNIDVRNGATFSSGIVEINENPSAAGLSADTNILVDDATFDVSNAVGFENSYFVSGFAGQGKTTITIAHGGKFQVRDTDGEGQAFAVFSNTYRADTEVTIGGLSGSGAPSSMQIDGLLFVAPAATSPTDSVQTLAKISVNAGGRLIVRDASVFAGDDRYAAVLDVRSGGYADLGERAILSGGNAGDAPAGGAGMTTLFAQGEIRAGSFEYMADPSSTPGRGGATTIHANGLNSKIVADGIDDPTTPEIDSGFFAPSRGSSVAGSDLATDGVASITVSGTLEANEAFFAGDMKSGQLFLEVTGAGALLDAGGLFAVNDRGFADSYVSIKVFEGGTLAATSSSNGNTGSIRINPLPGTGNVVLSVSSGSTLSSQGSIQIGGRLEETSPGVFQRSAGTPASVGSSGTIIAGAEVYVAAQSMLTSDGFDVNGTYIDGMWFVGAGGPSNRIRTGDLRVWAGGSVSFVDALPTLNPSLMVTSNLTIETGATFDLKRHAILIHPTAPQPDQITLASLKQLLANGRTGTGKGGISSSLTGATTALGYSVVEAAGLFLGEPTVPGDLLVRFTLKGDTNLNGAVDFDDLLTLAQHYGAAGEWFTGDVTFDGVVNFDDLLSVAQNYGSTLLSVPAMTDVFVGDWQLAQSLVPEPMSGALLLLASACSRKRR